MAAPEAFNHLAEALCNNVEKGLQNIFNSHQSTNKFSEVASSGLDDYISLRKTNGSEDVFLAKFIENWIETFYHRITVLSTRRLLTSTKDKLLSIFRKYEKKLQEFIQFESMKDLENARRQSGFYELHTHLLGMGSCEFWVDKVLCHVLPIIMQDQLQQLEFDTSDDLPDYKKIRILANRFRIPPGMTLSMLLTDVLHTNVENSFSLGQQIHGWLIAEFNNYRSDPELHKNGNFTLDVVYSEELLLKAMLGYDPGWEDMKYNGNEQDNLLLLENFLSNPASHVGFEKLFNHYTIFNVRKAKFECVFGITNEDLISLLELQNTYGQRSERARTILARIRNCFSMLDPNGEPASQQSLDSFRGRFTPCFFPMRYSLKDSIYEQQPVILSYLLNAACRQYLEAGVGYVEFSLGIADLANPRIYPFLDPEIAVPIADTFPMATSGPLKYFQYFIDFKADFPTKFEYCFLAGFPRNKSLFGSLFSIRRRKLVVKYGLPFAREVNRFVRKDISFNKDSLSNFLDALFMKKGGSISDIATCLQRIYDRMYRENPDLGFKNGNVVGMDLMSDENGNPFSPFLHPQVLEKLRMFQEKNRNFGIRLHGGENVFRGSRAEDNKDKNMKSLLEYNFYIHLMVIACEIEAFRSLNFKCRIGHGLGFTVLVSEFENQSDANVDRTESVLNRSGNIPEVSVTEPNSFDSLPPLEAIRRELYSMTMQWKESNDDQKFLVLFEVNPVSNKTLVLDIFCHEIGSRHTDKFIVQMLKMGLHICLGTDNDGIWPIGKCSNHRSHSSVAFEYCSAFKAIQTYPDISTYDRIFALLTYMTSSVGWFKNISSEALPINLFHVERIKPSASGPIIHSVADINTGGKKFKIYAYINTKVEVNFLPTPLSPHFYTGTRKEYIAREFQDENAFYIIAKPDEKSYYVIKEDKPIQTVFSPFHVTYMKYSIRVQSRTNHPKKYQVCNDYTIYMYDKTEAIPVGTEYKSRRLPRGKTVKEFVKSAFEQEPDLKYLVHKNFKFYFRKAKYGDEKLVLANRKNGVTFMRADPDKILEVDSREDL